MSHPDRRRRAIFRWTVAPPAARFEDVNDPRDHPPVIDAARAGLVLGKMRLDRRPGFIVQPKQVALPRLHLVV